MDTGFLYRRYRFSGLNTPLLFPGNKQGILWGVFFENEMDVDNLKSANARVTKHAPVALINQDNIHLLEKLHPTRSGGTRRKFKATPSQVVKTLSQLNRGK
jgi:hypothetical protein